MNKKFLYLKELVHRIKNKQTKGYIIVSQNLHNLTKIIAYGKQLIWRKFRIRNYNLPKLIW